MPLLLDSIGVALQESQQVQTFMAVIPLLQAQNVSQYHSQNGPHIPSQLAGKNNE
jgi:hypothetical protein